MRSHSKIGVAKISTTVSPETYHYLERMVKSGRAATLAEALDLVIHKIRKIENRKRLAEATTRYFQQLDAKAAVEENTLANDMTSRHAHEMQVIDNTEP